MIQRHRAEVEHKYDVQHTKYKAAKQEWHQAHDALDAYCANLAENRVEVTRGPNFEHLTVSIYACTDIICHCYSKALPLGRQDVQNGWSGCLQAEAKSTYAAYELISCRLVCTA